MREIRINSLQWAMGAYCAIMGALMLVTPHQFDGPVYAPVRPYLVGCGIAFLIAGPNLFAIAALAPSRRVVVIGHVFAGSALVLLGGSLGVSGAWGGMLNLVLFGLGTALAPLLVQPTWREDTGDGTDLFVVLMGIGATLTGLLMLTQPSQFAAPWYAGIRPYLHWFGLMLVGGGIPLTALQFRPFVPRIVAWPAYLMFAIAFSALIVVHVQHRIWTGIAFYGGFGVWLGLLPYLRPHLGRLDPTSLRTRLALILAAVAAVPMIVAVALISAQEERTATVKALAVQQTMARALAEDIANHLNDYTGIVAALANIPDLLSASPEVQHAILSRFAAAQPGMLAFHTHDVAGQPFVRSDDQDPMTSSGGRSIFEEARRTNGLASDILMSSARQRPVLKFGVPVRDSAGQLSGFVAGIVDPAPMISHLTKSDRAADGQIFTVDSQGRALIHPNAELVASLADLSRNQAVTALLSRDQPNGSLVTSNGTHFVGYARVPDWSWGVVIEQPKSIVLASIYATRELTLGMMLVAIVLAAIGGVIAAGRLTAPLGALAIAVRRFSAAATAEGIMPLPITHVTEVRHLTDEFRNMRGRLAAHEAERARAEEALRNSVQLLHHEIGVRRIAEEQVRALNADLEERVRDRTAQLQDAEAKYRNIFENAVEGIYQISVSGDLLTANPALAQICGYDSPEDLIGTLTDIERQLYVDSVRRSEFLQLLHQHGSTTDFESQIYRKDGSVIWICENARTICSDCGTPLYYEGTIQDITERKLAEQERARLLIEIGDERATMAAVMAGMTDGLIVVDAFGEIRYCNSQAGSMLNADPKTLTGKPAEAALASVRLSVNDFNAKRKVWRRALARSSERSMFELNLIGSPPRDIAVQVFPVADVTNAGASVGLLLHDVTRERDLERTKDELVSVVSHELRTPLSGLVGFAELLLVQDLPEEERRQSLSIMLDEGIRLTALLNDFLDLQRMESGHQLVHARPTNPTPLLERAVTAVGADPERPIVLDLPADIPWVEGDPERVQQVLANLLSNARKYSPAGGEVRISARVVDGKVEIAVADRGLGLPSEVIPCLFEKFHRVDNSDRRQINGTGLGLAICRKIIEAHGGRIWAESPGLGHGSTFRFTLPLTQAGGQERDILIVEHDVAFARQLEAELRAEGFRTIRTLKTEEAIEQLQTRKPIAAVLHLPSIDLSCQTMLERLSLLSQISIPTVVIMSGELSPEMQQELNNLGAIAVLPKGPGAATMAVATLRATLIDIQHRYEGAVA